MQQEKINYCDIMNIKLDFDNKTISVEDTVNLGELILRLEKLLPDWRKWDLKTATNYQNFSILPQTRYIPHYQDNPNYTVYCADSSD